MRSTWLMASLLVTALAAAPAAASHLHHHHHFRYVPAPTGMQPQFIAPWAAPPIGIAPPPPLGARSPAPTPRGLVGFPGGMTINVTKILHQDRDKDVARSTAPIERPKQAAEQLAACWSPPPPPKGDTAEITMRFSFNGRGEILGAPRVTYIKTPESSADRLRDSLFAAIKTCLPLRFTKSMAASAPGYPLSVRFIARRADE